MAELILTCKLTKHDHALELRSPAIGRVKLLVKVGQIIEGGHIIGEFFRLNKRFLLKIPDECAGKITHINDKNFFIDLAYDEPFLSLDPAGTIETCVDNTVGSDKKLHETTIDAPMDGMFYLSASPESPPFVDVGDEIEPGQTLGLIEVMKCFYPLKYNGTQNTKIKSINIKNATPINLGTAIFTVSK